MLFCFHFFTVMLAPRCFFFPFLYSIWPQGVLFYLYIFTVMLAPSWFFYFYIFRKMLAPRYVILFPFLYSNVGPKAYYLKAELALAEIALTKAACAYLESHRYRHMAGPEFVKTPIMVRTIVVLYARSEQGNIFLYNHLFSWERW